MLVDEREISALQDELLRRDASIGRLLAAVDRVLETEHGAVDRQTEACGLCKLLEADLAELRRVRDEEA